MKWTMFILILLCSDQLMAGYCIVRTITYHINTPYGMIVGQTTTTTCYGDTGGGGGGGSGGGSGGGGGGGAGSGGGGSTATVSNEDEFVDCLSDIIAYAPDAAYPEFPSGIRTMTSTHHGTDLFATNGTLIRSPVDGVILGHRDDVPRDDAGPSSDGNYISVRVDGAFPSSTPGSIDPNAAATLTLSHLDPGFFSEFGTHNRLVVRKGQIIARSDNTGSIAGLPPHLDITIRKGDGDYADISEISDCP